MKKNDLKHVGFSNTAKHSVISFVHTVICKVTLLSRTKIIYCIKECVLRFVFVHLQVLSLIRGCPEPKGISIQELKQRLSVMSMGIIK